MNERVLEGNDPASAGKKGDTQTKRPSKRGENRGEDESSKSHVGYRRPPVHSRFKPGESGNPKGRPKGSMNTASLLRKILNGKVTFREGQRIRTMSKSEAMHYSQVLKAIKGDSKAYATLMAMIREDPRFDGPPPSLIVNFVSPKGTNTKLPSEEGQETKPSGFSNNGEPSG